MGTAKTQTSWLLHCPPALSPDSLDPTGPDTFTFGPVDAKCLCQAPLQREPAPQLNLGNERRATLVTRSQDALTSLFRIQNLTLKNILSPTQSHKLTLIGLCQSCSFMGTVPNVRGHSFLEHNADNHRSLKDCDEQIVIDALGLDDYFRREAVVSQTTKGQHPIGRGPSMPSPRGRGPQLAGTGKGTPQMHPKLKSMALGWQSPPFTAAFPAHEFQGTNAER